MIGTPKRSVTRFFIPLIDVLILLFCIFLLMPAFNESEPEDPALGRRALEARKTLELTAQVKRLQEQMEVLAAFFALKGEVLHQ